MERKRRLRFASRGSSKSWHVCVSELVVATLWFHQKLRKCHAIVSFSKIKYLFIYLYFLFSSEVVSTTNKQTKKPKKKSFNKQCDDVESSSMNAQQIYIIFKIGEFVRRSVLTAELTCSLWKKFNRVLLFQLKVVGNIEVDRRKLIFNLWFKIFFFYTFMV